MKSTISYVLFLEFINRKNELKFKKYIFIYDTVLFLTETIYSLTTYPQPPANGISINIEDYVTLEEGEWLNDIIIDFYLKYLWKTMIPRNNEHKVYIFSIHFYTRLTRSRTDHSIITDKWERYQNVERWAKRENLFEKDWIFVPINER